MIDINITNWSYSDFRDYDLLPRPTFSSARIRYFNYNSSFVYLYFVTMYSSYILYTCMYVHYVSLLCIVDMILGKILLAKTERIRYVGTCIPRRSGTAIEELTEDWQLSERQRDILPLYTLGRCDMTFLLSVEMRWTNWLLTAETKQNQR